MISIDTIKAEYPLHYLIWNNLHKELGEALEKNEHDKEKRDARGRTPLMLAVTLAHCETARLLLDHDANVNCENADGWTVIQEAVATGDARLIQLVLERKEYQRYRSRAVGVPELLARLSDAPDFYVEMRWEFLSWMPLVSRLCPSDTYRLYKRGASVRIDTTLLGFEHNHWQRGRRTYIFQGTGHEVDEAAAAVMMEIDHDAQRVYVERITHDHPISALLLTGGGMAARLRDTAQHRLQAPIVTTYVDTDKISFERNKAWGVWGWRPDKTDVVNGHQCKVFSATNVELVTKTRTEHLSPDQNKKEESGAGASASSANALQTFLGFTTTIKEEVTPPPTSICNSPTVAHQNIQAEEYFDSAVDLRGRDIGRPKSVHTKTQKFRATLWLCEDYPLSLQEQIMPIVDLMAISSSHFAKLRDFIQMQLPAGFPVQIEVPLFHVLNARITFGNIFALDTPVPGVAHLLEQGALRPTCVVDDSCFAVPAGYTLHGSATDEGDDDYYPTAVGNNVDDQDDDLLQFAIQQSLRDATAENEQIDIWEALKGHKSSSRPSTPPTPLAMSPAYGVGQEDRQLQRAIQASLMLYNSGCDEAESGANEELADDSELRIALLLSEEEMKREAEFHLQEQKMLEEILLLSLTDK